MKRPSASEAREAIFREAADASQRQDELKPRPAQVAAAKMLVDGFGSDTKQPAPYMEGLHGAFTRAKEAGVHPSSALQRTPRGQEEAQRGISRSPRRFFMDRSWDSTKGK